MAVGDTPGALGFKLRGLCRAREYMRSQPAIVFTPIKKNASQTLVLRTDRRSFVCPRRPDVFGQGMPISFFQRTSRRVSRRKTARVYLERHNMAERSKPLNTNVHKHGSWTLRNPPLSYRSCEGNVLFIDASTAGISGDMFVAALLDLGVPFELLCRQLSQINLRDYSVFVSMTERSCISALRFSVQSSETDHRSIRSYIEIQELINASNLTQGTKQKALTAFTALAKAEGSAHGTDYERVSFHEVGAVDSVVDTVAVAICLEYLGVDEIFVSPLPLGRGVIRGTAHGPLPSPAPATLNCLCQSSIPAYDPGVAGEFVTPTGACLTATLSTETCSWPNMCQMLRVGYGAGMKRWADRPNLLRIVLGVRAEER